MRRFWVTLEDKCYDELLFQAEKTNASVGALAAEIIAKSLSKEPVQHSLLSIQKNLQHALNQMPDGIPFYIRDLVPDDTWNALSRSNKMTYAKTLARLMRNDPAYSIVKIVNKTNFYARTNQRKDI